MKIYLGADHGGFELKEKVKRWLTELGYQFEDLGNTVLDPNDDYPDFAFKVAQKVSQDPQSLGVLICRSAAGMIMAANKVKGIRAVAAFDETSAIHSREHNNANILGLSGDWTSDEGAKDILISFLKTEFSTDERHRRRVAKIDNYQ